LGNLLRVVIGGNGKKQNIEAAHRGSVESKARELAEREKVRVGLKKSTVTWELHVRELNETMERKEEVLKKLAAELEVMTARLGETEKVLVEAKASKEQATSKLAADLARAHAEATKAQEDANDSEVGVCLIEKAYRSIERQYPHSHPHSLTYIHTHTHTCL
jgi:hypothetical protein